MIAVPLPHFRDRRDEWLLSAVMLGFGLILLLPGSTFAVYPSYRLMASIAPEWGWGGLYAAAGVVRLVVLYINGARRETPFLRQCGAAWGMLLWAFLMMGAFGVDVHLPTIMCFIGFFVLEGMSLSAAARDDALAKRASGTA